MEKTIVFATSNEEKVREIREMLSPYGFKVISLKDLGLKVEAEEVADNFEDNARIKALDIISKTDYPVLSDDSGLGIHALNGFPGVHSSRFMEGHSYEEKCLALFDMLKDKEDRSATFYCAIVYVDKKLGLDKSFIGTTDGLITDVWDEGAPDKFGYDPVFFSKDLNKTFGRSTPEEKDAVSHRGRALEKLIAFLKETYKDGI